MDKTTAALIVQVCTKGNILITASIAYLETASHDLSNAAQGLLKVKAQLETDCDSKSPFFASLIAQQRTKSYAGATAGIALGLGLGPLGLLISEGAAAIITEVSLVPNLKKQLEALKQTYEDLRLKCEKSFTELKDDVTKVIAAENEMKSLRGGVNAAYDIVVLNPEDVVLVKVAFDKLEESCAKYCKLYEQRK